ncbi:peptide chain release factor N(5)-glutamine methyltransferase [Halobacillus shinanisalinarum]|uniref:Release factor glutamine methyltransferase n=1 Tax=Halobacillus shinanisalinarum TaxID=2932258 RepID=A0ABY4H3R6_9BACI|nr:peptide chain release factor N(5)-glutamine methyltransferase [Halobacillus shinanisalinarum]UOQ94969.1 peptide chain release factor N(5)-glutamine methyltransferase [Halobacillus shinanisalinarum]
MSNEQAPFATIQEARRWASLFLQKSSREVRVVDLLLEHTLELSFSQLLAYEHDPFPEQKQAWFIKAVEKHVYTGVPVQHLMGEAPFYGRDFTVNRHVLIPRPETEELILGTLQKMKLESPVIVDLGTGSGIIAITLKLECPSSQLLATDLSAEAIEVAKQNADTLNADIEFFQGDFLEPIKQQPVDVIISNPPYIAFSEKLSDTVENFDPSLALFAEEEGLAAYRTILDQIVRYKLSPSLIAFEIGHEQGEVVKSLIERKLLGYDVQIEKDINKKDRMIFAKLAD